MRYFFVACLVASNVVNAQARDSIVARPFVAVDSDFERYVRVRQITGYVQPYPWTVRGFSTAEVDRLLATDSAGPWSGPLKQAENPRSVLRLVAPEAQLIFNSAFPFGFNDGPVWAGRGLTAVVQGGVMGRAGRLSYQLVPEAFLSQNAAFALMPVTDTAFSSFADGVNPGSIDQPQRFGDRSYGRIDAGQSTVRLDVAGLALGVSTGNEHWGPAIDNPLILGNNAPGFLHGFVGTSVPANLRFIRGHGRVMWGRLDQSTFAASHGTQSRRFMAGIVASASPSGAPNLEIGGSRFFHSLWPDSGLVLRDFLRPFEGLLSATLARQLGNANGQEPDNQLASLFVRWTFPASGAEIYAELGREDHNADRRDLTLEPDHNSAYTLGVQKAFGQGKQLTVIRGELMNARVTSLDLSRPQSAFYVHTPVVQGHTQRGQILGAAAAYGGAGSVVSVERFSPAGGWHITWSRMIREPSPVSNALYANVIQSLEWGRLRFGRPFDWSWTATLSREFNRNFQSDVTNLRLTASVRSRTQP